MYFIQDNILYFLLVSGIMVLILRFRKTHREALGSWTWWPLIVLLGYHWPAPALPPPICLNWSERRNINNNGKAWLIGRPASVTLLSFSNVKLLYNVNVTCKLLESCSCVSASVPAVTLIRMFSCGDQSLKIKESTDRREVNNTIMSASQAARWAS